MSRFANALCSALQAIGQTQTEFARRSGIDVRQLNKYTRGKLDVGAGNIQIIARHLPERERAHVIAAWLRDMIPETASGLVAVQSVVNSVMETPTDQIPAGDLAPGLHDAIDYLVAKARRHTEVSDLLIDLARALRG